MSLQFFVCRRFNRIATDKILYGYVVYFMVAANHAEDRFSIYVEGYGFNRLFYGNLQEVGQIFDGRAVRRFDELYVGCVFSCHVQRIGDGLFNIGGILALRAGDDFGFAGCGQGHEFMGVAAANLAAVCFYRLEIQAAARKYTVVSVIHNLIGLMEAFFVNIERIGILHDEFAAAHEAEAGTDFVAVFILHLPKDQGHLLIRTQFVAEKRRNQFFMSRPEAVAVVVAVLQLEHFRPVSAPPARFMPDFGRLHDGHHDFLGACSVHFFADDLFYLQRHAAAQGQEAVQAAAVFPQHARFQHILMAGNLSVCRNLPQRRTI